MGPAVVPKAIAEMGSVVVREATEAMHMNVLSKMRAASSVMPETASPRWNNQAHTLFQQSDKGSRARLVLQYTKGNADSHQNLSEFGYRL